MDCGIMAQGTRLFLRPLTLPSPSRSAAQAGCMSAASSSPKCMCDCGEPNADRQQLLTESHLGNPWPRYISPYCGPEPAQAGGQRRCSTPVHPMVMTVSEGLLLCEECRDSCVRRKRERAERAEQDHQDAKRADSSTDVVAPGQSTGASAT